MIKFWTATKLFLYFAFPSTNHYEHVVDNPAARKKYFLQSKQLQIKSTLCYYQSRVDIQQLKVLWLDRIEKSQSTSQSRMCGKITNNPIHARIKRFEATTISVRWVDAGGFFLLYQQSSVTQLISERPHFITVVSSGQVSFLLQNTHIRIFCSYVIRANFNRHDDRQVCTAGFRRRCSSGCPRDENSVLWALLLIVMHFHLSKLVNMTQRGR